MTPARRLTLVVLGVALGALVLAFATRGSDPYTVSLPLSNASGLQDGSTVDINGVDRGRVKLELKPGDRVVAVLELTDDAPPIGRDASARVVAANFLGRKRVELDPGDPDKGQAPDGFVVAATRVTTPTDLDQVLGVFDADTRTRAQILLSAAGQAVVGRRVDIRHLLAQFPVGLDQAGPVLGALRTDDRTMHDLLERSDRVVDEVTRQRAGVVEVVDTLGQTAETVSARRDALKSTLAKAPGTLQQLRGFLGDLQTTAGDLGPAARQLTAAAPPLSATLAALPGFRKAAAPALDDATDAAKPLTQLAGVTPVVKRAVPVVQSLSTFARSAVPVTNTLNGSADNIIAVLDNWAHAIQFRDGLSHVFRGEATFSPDLVASAIDRLDPDAGSTPKLSKKPRPIKQPERKDDPAPAKPDAPKLPADVAKPLKDLPKPLVDDVIKQLPDSPTRQLVQGVVDQVLGGSPPPSGGDGSKDSGAAALLQQLLGGGR